jgi:hypothetical protein
MAYLPPTITPADDEEVPVYHSTPVETLPTITPVEPEIQYVEEPQIEYVEQPQIEYVEQPQIEYVEQPQEVVLAQPVAQPVVQPVAAPQEDLTKYYNILDQFGPVENDDDFQLDGWKQFYPLDDPFFNWNKGAAGPNWRVYNPEDKMNLAVYEGDMLNGMRHGFGRLTTPKYVRLGMWRDDQFTGWGRESRRNGDVLEGKYIDGRVTGKGILKNAKGNLYVGDFVESRRHGYGELDTNRIHYKGGFLGDRLNGRGIIHFKVEGHDYDGDFKDNEINGNGVFRWTNGDVYDGQMTRGKMNGFGRYTYANGQIYEGNYVNGIKEGKGRLTYPNGFVYDGDFVGGRPRGNANITSGGKTIPVEYTDGRFYQV